MFKIKCEQCAFTFPSQEDLFAHYDFCADYQLPDDKNSSKPAKRKLRRSSGPSIVESEEVDEECSKPKRIRRSPANLAEQAAILKQELLICKGCSKTFLYKYKDEFITHLHKSHASDHIKNYLARSEPIPGIIEEKCDTCHAYYKSATGVALHNCEIMVECRDNLLESRNNVLERKVHPCPSCYEVFTIPELIDHIQNNHTGLMAFIARSCPIPDAFEKQCEKCRCFYRDALDMSNHDCDKMIECRTELGRGQYDFNEETYVCRACHNLFNVEDMKKHINDKRHQKRMNYIARSGFIPGLNEVQCRICCCYFNSKSGENNHNCYKFLSWRLGLEKTPVFQTTTAENDGIKNRKIKETIT